MLGFKHEIPLSRGASKTGRLDLRDIVIGVGHRRKLGTVTHKDGRRLATTQIWTHCVPLCVLASVELICTRSPALGLRP